MDKRFLFLDTNIYLHAQPFDQIPWPGLASAMHVVLLLPQVTVKELDEKKRDARTERLRSRARATVLHAMKLVEGDGNVRDGVRLEEYSRLPTIDYGAYDLDELENDDRLLATILTCQREHEDWSIALVTNDGGPRLKARRLGIPVVILPEDYLLPSELSAIEKDLREAKTELARSRAAQPIVRASFLDGSSRMVVPVPPAAPSEADIAKAVEGHHAQYSLRHQDPVALVADLRGVVAPSEAGVERFARELPAYLTKWERWYRAEVQRQILSGRTISFALLVENTGRQPATDAALDLVFPTGVRVMESPAGEEAPEPQPPVRPRSPAEVFREDSSYLGDAIAALHRPRYEMVTPHAADLWRPEISAHEDGTRVVVPLGKIQQGAGPEHVRLLYVLPEAFRSFRVSYRIVCDELIEPAEGAIHVVYES